MPPPGRLVAKIRNVNRTWYVLAQIGLEALLDTRNAARVPAESPGMSARRYTRVHDTTHVRSSELSSRFLSHQAYLHKSSVAGCFVDLLDMTSEGEINEDYCHNSSFPRVIEQNGVTAC